MTKSVTDQINEILEQYGSQLNETVRTVAVDVAKSVANDLKSTSPKSRGRGSLRGGKHYANGWTADSANIPGGGVQTVVYNKTGGQLTHLLEHGHAIANQYGATGKRVPAKPHIAPAEQRGRERFITELENKL